MKMPESLAVMGLMSAALIGATTERPGGAIKKAKNKNAKRRNRKNKAAKASRKRNR